MQSPVSLEKRSLAKDIHRNLLATTARGTVLRMMQTALDLAQSLVHRVSRSRRLSLCSAFSRCRQDRCRNAGKKDHSLL